MVSIQEINAPTAVGEFVMAAPVVMSATVGGEDKKSRHTHAVVGASAKALHYKVRLNDFDDGDEKKKKKKKKKYSNCKE